MQLRRRVVFDTNVVLSALLFPKGRLAWLRSHWREGGAIPLISPATARELTRVLGYSKFRLSEQYRMEALALYIPYCESLNLVIKCPVGCRVAKDQPLLDLAHSGKIDVLVTGDEDLLTLVGQTAILPHTKQGQVIMVVLIEANFQPGLVVCIGAAVDIQQACFNSPVFVAQISAPKLRSIIIVRVIIERFASWQAHPQRP